MPPFGRRYAFQHHGGDWEGWTPPWMQEEWHGPHPRMLFRQFRRHFFGPRGPFGPGFPGPGETRRVFGRGDLKYVLLELLQERPMHGYEMMKALEDRSGGFYSPSSGSIYPTLQLLEDRGLVTVAESEGKKVYTITDAGRAFLGERQREEDEEFGGPPWAREFGRRWRAPEMQALRSEAMEVARLFTIAGRMSFRDQAQLNRLHDILERTRKELSDMIYGAGAPNPPSGGESTPGAPQQD